MPTLSNILTSPEKKDIVVQDCCTLIDDEVADKGGLSGFAIKAAYGAVKGISPGFVRQVVGDLVPEFANALQPIYDESVQKSQPIGTYVGSQSPRVANALLSITDQKATRSKSGVVKGAYDKLRPTAQKHVESAVPRLAKLLAKHVG